MLDTSPGFLALLLNINLAQVGCMALRWSMLQMMGFSLDLPVLALGVTYNPGYNTLVLLTSTLLEGRAVPCDSDSKLTDCGPASPASAATALFAFGFWQHTEMHAWCTLIGWVCLAHACICGSHAGVLEHDARGKRIVL